MRPPLRAFLLTAFFLHGCHAGPPPASPVNPPVAMTLFAADNDEFPDVVESLNRRLQGVFPRGPLVNYASISIQEAQIAVGCAESDFDCWDQLAEPLATPSLLIPEVKRDGPAGVRVSLLLYDAAGGRKLREAVRAYASPAFARDGVPEVVDLLVAPGGGAR